MTTNADRPDPVRRGHAAALAVAVGLMAVACEPPPPEPEPLRPVRVVAVRSTDGGRARSFSGVARAALESRLSFRVGGTLIEVPVRVGQTVSRGGLIALIDPEDYQLAVDDARAYLVQAQAVERRARADLERVRGLWVNKNASKSDLDVAEQTDDSARAAVESAQKKLERARLQLSYTRLEAPGRGTISEVAVERNENVSPGEVVAVLTGEQGLEVELAVPEQYIAQVDEGSVARVSFDAIPDRPFGARVTEVGVAATGTATTFPVIVALDERDPDLRPGMTAEVALQLRGEDRRRMLVPASAVAEDRKGRFVFVLRPDDGETGTVRRRPVSVRVDELFGDRLEILEGLADGEMIVTAGVSRIEDGQRVSLPATTTVNDEP